MTPLVPDLNDEGVHEHDDDPLWSESHYLDTVAPDGATGFYARIGRLPNQERSHVMLAVVRPDAGPVMIVDPAAPLSGLSLAAPRYDLAFTVTEPLRTVRVTARGTATAHEHDADPLHETPGQAVEIEVDLTWTTDAVPYRWRSATRYEIPCHVTGHLTVDGTRIDVDWVGQRDHSWGRRDWWSQEWCWTAVHLDDGSRWHSASTSRAPGRGTAYWQRDGEVTETTWVNAESTFPADGLFAETTVDFKGQELRLTPVRFAPVPMVADDGRVAFFPRATCRVTAPDGRRGVGWLEWNLQQPAESEQR